MDILLSSIWIVVQLAIGYNLIFPALLFCLYPLLRSGKRLQAFSGYQPDYAIVVTAYQFTETLPTVVNSILRLNYENYLVYIVADNCDISNLDFPDERVVLLRPPEILSSNTASHYYAMRHFRRAHEIITIIDSDNILDPDYLNQLNLSFRQGFQAVQGLRAAKNLDGTIACLDAARDIYYHFYDGQLLFECGSSASLAGSAMAFKVPLYQDFLNKHDVRGAGFDKVLQAWLVTADLRIAFNKSAVVYDEKTSRPDQLVKQRSRWINTWFKYFRLGFGILIRGCYRLSRNQFLFGLMLLRPPIFIFLILSLLFFLFNLLVGAIVPSLIWMAAGTVFVLFFFVALWCSSTDKRIYLSLINIPKFMTYQIMSLLKSRQANKISVSTQHFYIDKKEDKNKVL